MILYPDTSSLVKLYIQEDDSQRIHRQVDAADVVATSVVAFPEARSAFARLTRENRITPEELAQVRHSFLEDWNSLLKIRAFKRVYERAGSLTEKHALRGFDALHLASFIELLDRTDRTKVQFSSFDNRLNTAAAHEHAERE